MGILRIFYNLTTNLNRLSFNETFENLNTLVKTFESLISTIDISILF